MDQDLEELILPLRIHLDDVEEDEIFTDDYLYIVLVESVHALMNRWGSRYFIDNEGTLRRNPHYNFDWSSPPKIQRGDRRPIILQASILIKGGSKFSESGNAVSWRDEEISYSNIESARQRSSTLDDDIRELEAILPSRKLAKPLYGRLFGWREDYY